MCMHVFVGAHAYVGEREESAKTRASDPTLPKEIYMFGYYLAFHR